jgi:hypothetical protein
MSPEDQSWRSLTGRAYLPSPIVNWVLEPYQIPVTVTLYVHMRADLRRRQMPKNPRSCDCDCQNPRALWLSRGFNGSGASAVKTGVGGLQDSFFAKVYVLLQRCSGRRGLGRLLVVRGHYQKVKLALGRDFPSGKRWCCLS